MKIKKKAQMSLEFLLILTFLFVLLAFIAGIIGYVIVDVNVTRINSEREDFANMILSEFKLVESSSEGYSRTFVITSNLVAKYQPNITETYFTLNDIDSITNDTHYYLYEGDADYNISIVTDVSGIKYVTVSKNVEEENNFILLS